MKERRKISNKLFKLVGGIKIMSSENALNLMEFCLCKFYFEADEGDKKKILKKKISEQKHKTS